MKVCVYEDLHGKKNPKNIKKKKKKTCPYHFSLFSVIVFVTGATFTDPLAFSFLVLCFCATPHIHRSILISFRSSLFSFPPSLLLQLLLFCACQNLTLFICTSPLIVELRFLHQVNTSDCLKASQNYWNIDDKWNSETGTYSSCPK